MTGEWVKACNAGSCVEVQYVKACSDHACVEVGNGREGTIQVRDSHGNICVYDHAEWDAFTDGAKRGVFDRENLP